MSIPLWQKVISGLVLGVIFGFVFKEYVAYVKPIGDIFLRMIKMIITPIIFLSLVSGMTSMSDPSSLGRVGLKAVIAFLCTTCFAVIFGITVALVLKPGHGVIIDFGNTASNNKENFNIAEMFINVVPDNIFSAFASGNVLQVVFFAIITGSTMNIMTNSNSISFAKDVIHSFSKIMLKMISTIMLLSPYGAFALTAWVVGTQGLSVIFSLSKLVFAVSIAMVLQYLIFGALILVFCRISPIPFYKKSLEYQSIAFSTSSSKASLPLAMQVCRDKLGISESSTSFILPLGASINMDGLAINLGLSTIFVAQSLGVDLAISDYFIIVLMSTICSIGGAGIPGSSLIMLPLVLSAVNLPIECIGIFAGIDRILDMLRTTINITGDATITLIIDSTEKTLDKAKYYK